MFELGKEKFPSKKSDETLLRICIQYSTQNIQNTAAVFSVRQTVGIIADQVEGEVPVRGPDIKTCFRLS